MTANVPSLVLLGGNTYWVSIIGTDSSLYPFWAFGDVGQSVFRPYPAADDSPWYGDTDNQRNLTFSLSDKRRAVPDTGSAALLLGMGLTGLVVVRRWPPH